MAERLLAGGIDVVQSPLPLQLYAGESDIVTTHGTVAAGLILGTVVSGRATALPVVAVVGHKMVAYNPAGNDGSEVPYGVLPHPIDTSATGTNADTESPVIIGAVLNFEALSAGGATLAVLREAFALAGNSNITIQDLY